MLESTTYMHSKKPLRSASVGSGCAHSQFQLLVEVAVENASVPPDVDRVPNVGEKTPYVGVIISMKETQHSGGGAIKS